jgi:AcrR family transcriptional regulator
MPTATEPRLTPKGRATRARIVEVAAQLMFQNGVGGTSVEDVLHAAGVSASQLYHYFDDKPGLVRAVIAHQTDTMLALQAPALDSLDSLAALRAWRDLLVDVQRQRRCTGGCAIGSLASELAEADALARADLAAGFARWEGRLRDGLRAMCANGVLRPDADPDRLALGILTSLQGGMLLTQLRRDPHPLEVALDSAIAYVETFAT